MPDYHVIDADGHIAENRPGLIDWEAKLPQEYKHLAPKFIPFATGGGRLFIEGKIWPFPSPKGRDLSGGRNVLQMMDARPGMWEPDKRIADMDVEGIHTAVLFGGPTMLAISAVSDGAFGAALARVYNDWAASFCSYAPQRLKAAAAVPVQSPELAVAELERCVRELGAVACVAPPHLHNRTIDRREFWPVFDVAQRLNVPVCIHTLGHISGIEGAGTERFPETYYQHAIVHPFEQMIASLCLISGGVFDAFPRLRFAFLEGNCGWLPFWAERMDSYWEALGRETHPIQAKPSEYVRGSQLYVGCDPGEQAIPWAMEMVGDDRLVYASDYWHVDGKFPGTVKEIVERSDLSETRKRKLLGENAARLFNLGVSPSS